MMKGPLQNTKKALPLRHGYRSNEIQDSPRESYTSGIELCG
ncbi:Uncharacterised protein [Sphingobacterium thalpophilum]|uniref:Uncharacterized protein n=1 Tax=Sphingobacterium thalpophilum TaxID=259 RepID=A0A4U9V3Q5_9SPHI|nr:Uncharacterised protein [Sphingobacterium thalpophilum]